MQLQIPEGYQVAKIDSGIAGQCIGCDNHKPGVDKEKILTCYQCMTGREKWPDETDLEVRPSLKKQCEFVGCEVMVKWAKYCMSHKAVVHNRKVMYEKKGYKKWTPDTWDTVPVGKHGAALTNQPRGRGLK